MHRGDRVHSDTKEQPFSLLLHLLCEVFSVTSAFFYALEQLQFNRNVPAVPENLALRFANPRPIIIEKLKASDGQRNLAGHEDSSLRSSGVFSVVSEERLKLAVELAKRDIKRRHREEQVKQQVIGDTVNKLLLAQKSKQQKTKVFESLGNKKPQTHLKCHQKLGQHSNVQATAPGTKVYLYTPNEGKLIPAGLDSPPTRDGGPDPTANVNQQEDQNVQEVRRLQKELRSYIQKIEDLTKKGVRLNNNSVIYAYSSLLACFSLWFFWLGLESVVFSSGFLRTIHFFQEEIKARIAI